PAPLVLLAPARRLARQGAAAHRLPARPPRALPPAPPLQDAEPARRRHRALARAAALRHARALPDALDLPPHRLLLRRASIRRRRVGCLDRPPRAAPHRRSDGAPASPLRYSASCACRTSFAGAPRASRRWAFVASCSAA